MIVVAHKPVWVIRWFWSWPGGFPWPVMRTVRFPVGGYEIRLFNGTLKWRFLGEDINNKSVFDGGWHSVVPERIDPFFGTKIFYDIDKKVKMNDSVKNILFYLVTRERLHALI